MSKVIHCRDAGFDCEHVIRADTEEEVLRLAAKHAQETHGVAEITPEIVAKVRSVVREE